MHSTKYSLNSRLSTDSIGRSISAHINASFAISKLIDNSNSLLVHRTFTGRPISHLIANKLFVNRVVSSCAPRKVAQKFWLFLTSSGRTRISIGIICVHVVGYLLIITSQHSVQLTLNFFKFPIFDPCRIKHLPCRLFF